MKDKYLQIFNYLLEFSKIRARSIKNIETAKTNYTEILWMKDIPNNNDIDYILNENFNNKDYFLKITKPVEPTKPIFPEPPSELIYWIIPSTLLNRNDLPELFKEIGINEEKKQLNDNPDILATFEKYCDDYWINDSENYWAKRDIYDVEFNKYEETNNIYKRLFSVYNKANQFGEEYELLMGVGLIFFRENKETPLICRHIVTTKTDIEFDFNNNNSSLIVSQNLLNTLQIETDSIIDLFDQFDSNDIIEAEKMANELIKEKELVNPFDNEIHDVLQLLAERIKPGDGNYRDFIEKPTQIPNKETIFFAPALILRKRNTRSFTALYEQIIKNIENEDSDLEIPTLNDLVGFHESNEDNASMSETENNYSEDQTIYFPKEWNDEQIEIVSKSKINNKILVQGPPGTGKSHTIANLICHLLANGKKVLITAYTPRALEVLKEKIPIEFQDLVVNLLSGDSSSIKDLQSSVNSINDELSRANLNEYQNEIIKLEKRLKTVREEIAINTNELVKIKEKSTRNQQINSIYSGTLTEIAEKLEIDSKIFDWYKDSFCDINNKLIVSDLQCFIEQFENYKKVDVSEFEFTIPKLENIPSYEQIKDFWHIRNELLKYNTNKEHLKIKCSNFEELKKLLIELNKLYKQTDLLQIDFTDEMIENYLKSNAYNWKQKNNSSSQLLKRIKEIDLKQIDRDIEISYNSVNSIKQLKNDAQILLNYLNEGNTLSGFSFSLKRNFLSKKIKERLYFIENIRVNGSTCDTTTKIETVIKDIELQQDFEELAIIWNSKLQEKKSYLKKFLFFKNIDAEVNKLINIIEESEKLKLQIAQFSGIRVNSFDRENVLILINETEYNHLLKREKSCKETIKKVETYLNQENTHIIRETILNDFKLFDYHNYNHTINNVKSLIQKKDNYLKFKELQDRVNTDLHNLLDSILSNDFVLSDLSKFEKVVYFKHAQNEINRLLNSDYETSLFDDLFRFEQKEKKLIANIASKKAWCFVIEDLQYNRSLRQHLNAWVMAVKKIGKTGRGKRAMKFRKIAQLEMEHCKDSVPCWIMPLYKVAETINPEQEMYDYIIIDEASQLGPDAIFLLYITKNIIIVGDDKQTSPEYVGVRANTMTPYINKYLQGIPFSAYYGTEFSFFDHSKFFCDGITVLREHFRCMPEIIEFSNKHFYAPDGMGLYPLKQYSEKRLKPLESIFCSNGFTEGIGARIINKPEAETLANTIANLTRDERYDNKTFGIITLQGNQQSNIIDNLLLKLIGEQEYHKRKIVCGNSASFQGDERDIIFLSLITAHNHNRSSLTKPEDERRFNVALSRAIEQVWLFHSVQLEDLNPNDLRYKLLNHMTNYHTQHNLDNQIIPVPVHKTKDSQPSPFDSWFEVEVRNDIVANGYSVIPQYEVAKGKYRIDMVALFDDGTKIAIECDGDKWHGVEQYQKDLTRQKVLERCGWQFFRIRGSEYYSNRKKSLEPLWEIFESLQIINKQNEKAKQEIEKTILIQSTSNEQETDSEIKAIPIQAKLSNDSVSQHKITEINLSRLLLQNELLIFTNKHNVYKLINKQYSLMKQIVEKLELEEKEMIIYVTGTNDYSGYMLFGFENGKVSKILMKSYETKTHRKHLKNAYNNDSKLIFCDHIRYDKELIAISSINKILVFNTDQINPKMSKNSQGVQVMRPKNNSLLIKIKNINQVDFRDIDYYKKKIPATGNFILDEDDI